MLREMRTSPYIFGRSELYHENCFSWLRDRPERSVHGVVTDPPYGVLEYTAKEVGKLRSGKGGVWRQPPILDGIRRAPLPRFTALTARQLGELDDFFSSWATALFPALTPGAHVLVASNSFLAPRVAEALLRSGDLEYRGSVARLVQTMRGGDRPKGAHEEFSGVSVMPRGQYEPWLLLRRPLEGRVQDNLRRWGTGGLRRIGDELPFGDVIRSAPTRKEEKALAPHPSLKPQAFLRQVVYAILPFGEGIVLDPFAGSGATLAAAEAVGYQSIGVEHDADYVEMACRAIPALAALPVVAA